MTEPSILNTTSGTVQRERSRVLAASMASSDLREQAKKLVRDASGMNALGGVSESWWKQVTFRDPMQDIRDSLAQTTGIDFGLKALRIPEQSVAESYRRQFDSMYRSFGEDAGARFIKAATGFDHTEWASGGRVQQLLQDLSGDRMFRQLSEQAERWRAPYEQLRKSLLPLHESLERSSAQAFLEKIARASSSVDLVKNLADVEVDSPGQPESASEEQEQAVAELVADVANHRSIQDAVNHIVVLLEDARESRLQRFLLLVIYPLVVLLLGAALNPVGDVYVKKALEPSSKQEATKNMRAAGRDAVPDIRMLKEHRFVGARHLQVMATAKARGAVIGKLEFGQVVRVVERDRDFTLISWTSEDGKAELQGWVFSRYLERFR